ncbi:DUF1491 family protein [Sphingomonas sp. NFR15]|uniref:DUF1491 family protein n=1 Tax=Sphingomonas sp. NFR15 TaxID=1566282 RepID=UPI00088AD50A|nr:DUF1491 family protein [Sphingomonas sp. NFR15]SDA33124.1 hypothetical protein SAMN03159340_02849 [Sphingomonas sp. NFR15]
MNDRLPIDLLVSALLRRANDAGGMAMVLAKGDSQAGSILLILNDKGRFSGMLEQGRDLDGRIALVSAGPPDTALPDEVTSYWQRRRARDPDLWVIDLDIPSAQRFAAETIAQH